ncbi:alkylmercury lyase family protein [Falsiroseomonas tokyonensis]|uniref:Alkylmercury lyase family protein n=1 Tax=Falsiroseomonas tokyonensis TaxID=430521 RepID=A0ABV7C259_9PROT|nr:alkylmercury lyase family protein [Falsiroseomonas tokyonensis]MBU8541937.1 alkylmercury lyase family protein [Falsiroseomonas tokyonensis]
MDTIERTFGAVGESFALRPGVPMPDWSPITDPTAREALAASMVVARRAEKWSGLNTTEDRIWQAVLRGFARSGAASDAARLAAGTGLDEPAVVEVLRKLQRRDLVVLDERGTAVTAAYPFSARETGHRVRLDGLAAVHALCAIDALGLGAMLGCNTAIESSCPECGMPIGITTRDKGRALASATPATAVAWTGIRYADGCGATSGCTVKVFLCSDEHLTAWRQRVDPGGAGFRLSLEAALQVGKGLFVPMLASRPEEDRA